MQLESEDALASLETKSGKDFDQAYLQLQIDEHRQVLKKLDQELLPAARNPGLKAYLQEIKPKVESHLAQAERLQQELSKTSLNAPSQRPLISNKPGQTARLSNDEPR
jgi:predicted outer membrane protein